MGRILACLMRSARLAALGTAVLAALRAEVALAPLFTDGAVLQREKPVLIWGTAAPGEKVGVSFGGQYETALTSGDGRWTVVLQPMTATLLGADLVVAGKANTLAVHNVLVGEVWLCSGQSNMEFPVSRAMNAEREIAAADFPLIREMRVERRVAEQPAEAVATAGWKPAVPANVAGFSAVGYFFARDLFLRLGVPIGILHSSWGGTPIESWLSPMALASNPAFAVVTERWAQTVANFPAARLEYDARLASWAAADAAAKAQGSAAYAAWSRRNPKPRAPRGPGDPWTPASLFNGMINPLTPYTLRGFLWYQGESNTDRPEEYHALFAAMITAWRAHFGQGDVPFYWVNLANFQSTSDPNNLGYARLREAQTQTLSLPNTGQALAIDIGNPNDIHPTNKQEVGRRLALLARRRVYGLSGDDTGPTFASAAVEGRSMRVHFTHVSMGLVAHDKPVQSLEVAGADHVFHPATGRIERETLLVTSPEVKQPVAVRYAWRNAPEANLYNGDGLPAVPFRSDNW